MHNNVYGAEANGFSNCCEGCDSNGEEAVVSAGHGGDVTKLMPKELLLVHKVGVYSQKGFESSLSAFQCVCVFGADAIR